MAHINFDPALLETLIGKVVVLTGGATGIGRSCVQQFCSEFEPGNAGECEKRVG